MENTAYEKAWLFSWLFYFIIIAFSLLQYALFVLYNGRYHPMAMILEEFFEKGEFRLHHIYQGLCMLNWQYDQQQQGLHQ